MSVPGPTLIYDPFVGAFTDEELDSLVRYCDSLILSKASLNSPSAAYDDNIRNTQVAAIGREDATIWFYKRLVTICRQLNERSFQFDLTGFSEEAQYMVYHASEGSHFDWHFDTGPLPPRKVSLTIQLSDPAQYEGGELQFSIGTKIVSAPKNRGVVIGFPSYMIHRVTPVTAGTRKAIVTWITGPKFR